LCFILHQSIWAGTRSIKFTSRLRVPRVRNTDIINEKDDLLECQEDLLVKENKKFVKLKNAYALEVEKNENLSKELSIYNDSISCLRDENAILNSKIDELNVYKPSTSTVEHATICTRCRDVNIEAVDDHLAIIKQ
jgi:serine phosphatase RsbU (regulator of sigma subunit)